MLIILVVVIALATVGYFVWKTKKNKPTEKEFDGAIVMNEQQSY